MKKMMLAIFVSAMLVGATGSLYAHCDTYDGPVIRDAILALQKNNVSLVLKWVDQDDEKEIIDLFNKTYSLKGGNPEIYQIVERYFFETLVRLHRESEGEPYNGLKPAGNTPEIISMSDLALQEKNIDDLLAKLDPHINSVIREKYERVIRLEKIKDESVEDGRAYVEAYVDYTHTLVAIHSVLESGPGVHSHE